MHLNSLFEKLQKRASANDSADIKEQQLAYVAPKPPIVSAQQPSATKSISQEVQPANTNPAVDSTPSYKYNRTEWDAKKAEYDKAMRDAQNAALAASRANPTQGFDGATMSKVQADWNAYQKGYTNQNFRYSVDPKAKASAEYYNNLAQNTAFQDTVHRVAQNDASVLPNFGQSYLKHNFTTDPNTGDTNVKVSWTQGPVEAYNKNWGTPYSSRNLTFSADQMALLNNPKVDPRAKAAVIYDTAVKQGLPEELAMQFAAGRSIKDDGRNGTRLFRKDPNFNFNPDNPYKPLATEGDKEKAKAEAELKAKQNTKSQTLTGTPIDPKTATKEELLAETRNGQYTQGIYNSAVAKQMQTLGAQFDSAKTPQQQAQIIDNMAKLIQTTGKVLPKDATPQEQEANAMNMEYIDSLYNKIIGKPESELSPLEKALKPYLVADKEHVIKEGPYSRFKWLQNFLSRAAGTGTSTPFGTDAQDIMNRIYGRK